MTFRINVEQPVKVWTTSVIWLHPGYFILASCLGIRTQQGPTKMHYIFAYTTIVVTLTLTLLHHVNAIDLKGSEESSCFDVKKTVSVDLNWAMSQSIWYYTLMSRYDIYHMSAEFLSDTNPKDIREDQVYYDTCAIFWLEGGKYWAKGFGNKKLSYSVKPIKGLEEFEFSADNEGAFMNGKCYTTLTDHKTFMFAACCLSDGQMTWAVSSLRKQLPEETKKLIYDHAESLGFKREYFTAFRYDSCPEGFEEKQELYKNEL